MFIIKKLKSVFTCLLLVESDLNTSLVHIVLELLIKFIQPYRLHLQGLHLAHACHCLQIVID
jgi:hypothetical protein